MKKDIHAVQCPFRGIGFEDITFNPNLVGNEIGPCDAVNWITTNAKKNYEGNTDLTIITGSLNVYRYGERFISALNILRPRLTSLLCICSLKASDLSGNPLGSWISECSPANFRLVFLKTRPPLHGISYFSGCLLACPHSPNEPPPIYYEINGSDCVQWFRRYALSLIKKEGL